MSSARWRVVAIGGAGVLLAACGTGGDALTTTPGPSGVRVELPVTDWAPGPDPTRFALKIAGQLVAEGDCIRMRESLAPHAVTTPLWPAGSTAYRVGDVITVYDAAGFAVAATGDQVDYVAGYAPTPHPNACTQGQSTLFITEDLHAGY